MSFLKRDGGYLLRLIAFNIIPKLLVVTLYLLFIMHIKFKTYPIVSEAKIFFLLLSFEFYLINKILYLLHFQTPQGTVTMLNL